MKTLIKGASVRPIDTYRVLGLSKDKMGRAFPSASTPEWVREYLTCYRTPSAAWPKSYQKALESQKFAKLLASNDPVLADQAGLFA